MSTGTFTDARDGKIYKTVRMPDGKWWAAENLTFATADSKLVDGNAANTALHGRLYRRDDAVANVPAGCHIPTRLELESMFDSLGLGDTTPGYSIPAAVVTALLSADAGGSDAFGFGLLKSGRFYTGYSFIEFGITGWLFASDAGLNVFTAEIGGNRGFTSATPSTNWITNRFIVDSGNVPDFQWLVFGYDPDWSQPVTESVEYKTQTLTARTGMEQRYRLRHVPRRSLSFDVLNIGQSEVQRFASLLWQSQSDLFAVPWWPDKIQYTGTIASGATTVTITTTNRLFALAPMAVLWESPTKCEAVTISATTGTNITISATTQAYTNPLVLPAFPGRLDPSLDVSVLALRASSATVKFSCEVGTTDVRPNPSAPAQAYGFDVLTVEPNADGQRWGASRIIDRLDNGFGKVAVVDRGAVSFQSADFNWFVNGRTEAQAFRDFIDRRAGRLVPFWVPTWREDLTLSAQSLSSAQAITIPSVGYTARMYPNLARRYLAIRTPTGGWIYRKVTSASDNGTNETLTLDGTLGTTLPAGTIVSFLTLCRLDSDEVAIDWETPIFGQTVTKFVELPREVPV